MTRAIFLLAVAVSVAGCGGGGGSSSDNGGGDVTIIKSGTLPTDAQLCTFALPSREYTAATPEEVIATIGGSPNVRRDTQGNITEITYEYTEQEPQKPFRVQVLTGFDFDPQTHVVTCINRGGLGAAPLPACLPTPRSC